MLRRALLAVRTDPNWFWMLLSGNAEVAFPSTTASLPASAMIAAATSNTAAVTVTTAVTVTSTRAAASNRTSTVDSLATPTTR